MDVIGEWWKSDVEAVINEALKSGLAPNVSDAHTINGYPGPVKNCNSQGTQQHILYYDNIFSRAKANYFMCHVTIIEINNNDNLLWYVQICVILYLLVLTLIKRLFLINS